MTFDLDRYYTPQHVARRALEKADFGFNPTTCADTTCGSGRLLDAATEVFGGVQCLGIDRDQAVIRALRRRRPEWTLATGDLLSSHAYRRSFSQMIPRRTDLLLMNPPFSQGAKKHLQISYGGSVITGSVAMAYILRSFELFKPRFGAILIVPESLLFSNTDLKGRGLISADFQLRKLTDLRSSTFKGARAHACVVYAEPDVRTTSMEKAPKIPRERVVVTLNRGCLPVFEARVTARGLPFLHSTDINAISGGRKISRLSLTSANGARTVSGWVVLVPRVGIPNASQSRAVYLPLEVRLSDCVIAIRCASRSDAEFVESKIRRFKRSFCELYKGTGARYVTMSKLSLWLATHGISIASND